MYKKKLLWIIIAIFFTFLIAACNVGENENSSPVDDLEPINTATGVSPTDDQNAIDAPITAELLGFEGGNIGAGGLVCNGRDSYIYYRSESDGWKLYRAKPDGSEKKNSVIVCRSISMFLEDGYIFAIIPMIFQFIK
ncbi:MAG TPA: hypothetical protein PKW03_10615 [Acetivibrio sp.]|nr:hypothetical protein [Clostridium sp.]HOQ38049.1 hypothetical protein [Acetivibrio sp.]HPT91976.1 hypothetical protein [Acetivibrio sp.]